jgi:hypothetical protein
MRRIMIEKLKNLYPKVNSSESQDSNTDTVKTLGKELMMYSASTLVNMMMVDKSQKKSGYWSTIYLFDMHPLVFEVQTV